MRLASLRFLVFLMLSTLLAAPAFAAPAKLVGSWASVSVSDQTGDEVRTLWTFNFDRTLTVAGDVANASSGHGAWKRTGPRTYEATNIVFGFGPDGSLAFTLKNQATFEVAPGGQTFTAAFSSEVLALDGTVITTTSGTATGERIKVD